MENITLGGGDNRRGILMNNEQFSNILNGINIDKVIKQVKKIFCYHYSRRSFKRIKKEFKLITKLFSGKFPGYKACNTRYHNLMHTLDTVWAIIRLIDGYNITNEKLPEDIVVNLLSAGLLHDTGYIQKIWDKEGTGAKYTKIHVKRSNEFVLENYMVFGIDEDDVSMIGRFISCSGITVDIESIDFIKPTEKICGAILGTADLLSQMADRVYLEKLLFLYYEFREAGIPGYNTEFDIIQKTVYFYNITKARFKKELLNVQENVKSHFKVRYNIDRNLYMDSIDSNIAYINKIIDDDTTNFRNKLHRISV